MVLIGKFITLNICIRNKGKSLINDSNIHLRKLENKEQNTIKASTEEQKLEQTAKKLQRKIRRGREINETKADSLTS
jgi:Na+-translocating ferredoxin:NAD+ oxidoreductase RnfC subunit